MRTSLFVSGCRNRCKNCFTPSPGTFCTASPLTKRWRTISLRPPVPAGSAACPCWGASPLSRKIKRRCWHFFVGFRTALPGKTVWCYTGFTLEELLGKSGECRACTPHTRELLGLIDILVDGRYEEELADITLAFRGSKNQRVLTYPLPLLPASRCCIWNKAIGIQICVRGNLSPA